MRKFIYGLIVLSVMVTAVFAVLLFAIPADKNSYLCEYNKKVKIMETTPGPRLILIGTSTLAYGVDSKQVADSLGIRVVNMGLHGGIGMRYCLDDQLKYVRKGDYVFISPSYISDLIDGGNGKDTTLADLMVATGWRNFSSLNWKQKLIVANGIPFLCFRNAIRLLKSPKVGLNSPVHNDEYKYVASGFNEYGDEESHWTLPSKKGRVIKKPTKPLKIVPSTKGVDKDFAIYLKDALAKYERKGAVVRLMPEFSSETSYLKNNVAHLEEELHQYGISFFTSSENLMFSGSFGYHGWGDVHFSREGVTIASARMATLIKEEIHR